VVLVLVLLLAGLRLGLFPGLKGCPPEGLHWTVLSLPSQVKVTACTRPCWQYQVQLPLHHPHALASLLL
jgi:hypothetical protein